MVELSHSHREHHAFNAFSPLQSQLAINPSMSDGCVRKHIRQLKSVIPTDYITSHHLGEVTEMVCSVKISAQILGDITEMVYSVKVSAQS